MAKRESCDGGRGLANDGDCVHDCSHLHLRIFRFSIIRSLGQHQSDESGESMNAQSDIHRDSQILLQ